LIAKAGSAVWERQLENLKKEIHFNNSQTKLKHFANNQTV